LAREVFFEKKTLKSPLEKNYPSSIQKSIQDLKSEKSLVEKFDRKSF
jgi:hypothetical protein